LLVSSFRRDLSFGSLNAALVLKELPSGSGIGEARVLQQARRKSSQKRNLQSRHHPEACGLESEGGPLVARLFGACSAFVRHSFLWNEDSIAVRENRGMGYEAKKTEHAGPRRGNGAYWGRKWGSQEGEQPAPAEKRAAGNPVGTRFRTSAVGLLAIEHPPDLQVLAFVAEEDTVVLGAEAE
jgi:hypothetical protein